ncbi:hypothetical protein I6G56_22875 [Burkholderia humptydooensis]|uniref:Uncharacterized protein n=1 Tax=Burkholderia humptydooensis TaxID=430531 RepID=A0A7T2X394_9BURK|nr:hypothetical protein I6G56_22875 [Burkholderia humptydooensis]
MAVRAAAAVESGADGRARRWTVRLAPARRVARRPHRACRRDGRADRSVGAEIHFHFDVNERLVAMSGFGPAAGFAKEMKLARMIVERGDAFAPDRLADPAVRLKALL